VLLRLAELAADIPEIAELDINPLLADQAGVVALDARIRIAPAKGPPGSNFAIRPYPAQLETVIETRTGARYGVRPIRPDDAPRLQAHVAACAPEDLRMRFLGALKSLPPQLALRLSQIDYAREMAFVAVPQSQPDVIAGVVRLSADPDGERAEFAVLVRSDLKGHGLGYRLMEAIIDYARSAGVKELFGDALAENAAMLQMAGELGFGITHRSDGLVEMTRTL
jgi:acetyltransferase